MSLTYVYFLFYEFHVQIQKPEKKSQNITNLCGVSNFKLGR